MRVPAAFVLSALAIPAMGAGPVNVQSAHGPAAKPASECMPTTAHVAEQRGIFREPRLTPRKLTELPPAPTYMAVFRHIGGCEAPLTMVEYRNPRRR